ncbi:MAG: hypothetical protein H6737_27115 [Alphaproteobacteria bacterium]|nr:hypothetical protein [Alphaproteobacteria bacterium]
MIALVALFACKQPVESTGVWMESSGYGWEFFNHRMSHVELGVTDSDAYASIVGGTSTTNVVTELDAQCDPDTCDEFPFFDNADIRIGWGRVTSTTAVFGSGSAQLEIDADGETASITVDLPAEATGTPTAVIRGYSFDTAVPLSGGTACYQPKNGWIPKSLGIELGEPVLSGDGKSVTLDVTGRFQAGLTHEDERQCIDAVIDQARIALRVEVLVAVTEEAAETVTVSQSMQYAYTGSPTSPGEQPDPDWSQRTLGTDLGDPLVGWSRFDFTFHEVGEDRGAYVRTLHLDASAADDVASGHATNFSPGTQLSAFDYAFEGTVQTVDVGEGVQHGAIAEIIPVGLDEAGVPVVVTFAL